MASFSSSRSRRARRVPVALVLVGVAAAGCDGAPPSAGSLFDGAAAHPEAADPGASAIPGAPSLAWSPASSMNSPRLAHTAKKLTSGMVVVAGGVSETSVPSALPGQGSFGVSPAAEAYDPSQDQWSPLPPMLAARIEHTMVTLPGMSPPDGEVLVIGGRDDSGNFLASAEIFDGVAWQGKASLSQQRAGHTATRLQSDRVLVVGGYDAQPALLGSGWTFLCSAEIYDFTAGGGQGAFVPTGSLAQCRANHTETLLANGKVLVTGGESDGVVIGTTEIWSAPGGLWGAGPPMSFARWGHTATRLSSGVVLITGGNDGVSDLKSAEAFDPVTGTWMTVGPMSEPRSQHAAVLLGDGRVLLTGGYQNGSALDSAEIYDPVTKMFTATLTMADFRARHTATLLASGEVLVAGGDDLVGDPSITSHVERFSLTGAQACGASADCPTGFCVDGVCCDTACDQACQACTQAARGSADGKDGVCGPVVKGLDPADDCAAMPASSCGNTGVCDGNGACGLFLAGTVCEPAACSGAMGTVALPASVCDGAGTCVDGMGVECAPYACVATTCTKGCKGPPDCAPSAFCDGVSGACKPKLPDGAAATDPGQCISGLAADGLCCDQACDQECQTCAMALGAAADGVCTPVSNQPCDDGTACTQVDTCQAGQCVGMQPVNCPGDTGCTGGLACDPQTGACSVPTPPKDPGDACEDGDVCTAGETCSGASECLGSAVACPPGECQSSGQCVPEVGCQFEPEPDFTPCNKDENPCTNEVCLSGACVLKNLPDLSGCPGGTCFAGECVPDGGGSGTGTGSGAGGGTGTGGGAGGGTGGNGGPAGGGDPGTGGGGSGGAAGDGGGYSLLGGACSVPAGGAGASGLGGAAIALAALAGGRRRRRGARMWSR